MGLLAGAEHASESSGEEEKEDSDDSSFVRSSNEKTKAPLTREDKKAMALLIVLCAWFSWSRAAAGLYSLFFFLLSADNRIGALVPLPQT
jgi:hypothetical protein